MLKTVTHVGDQLQWMPGTWCGKKQLIPVCIGGPILSKRISLAGLATLFAGFELLSLNQEEQRRPASWHWHILAERRRTATVLPARRPLGRWDDQEPLRS